jgi:cell division septal protein FtsQ
MKRRVLAAAAVLLGVVVLWFTVPLGLRRLDFFQLRRIEIEGLRYLPPSEILSAFAAPDTASLFERWSDHRDRVLGLPGVVAVDVDRRVPGTLVLWIEETAPVAVSPGPEGMALVAPDGAVLPYEPRRPAPDLPVLFDADSAGAGLLGRIREVAPALYGRISTIRRSGGDLIILIDRGRLLLQSDASVQTILSVEAVERDLLDRGRGYRELDGRYADQVVVRGGPA